MHSPFLELFLPFIFLFSPFHNLDPFPSPLVPLPPPLVPLPLSPSCSVLPLLSFFLVHFIFLCISSSVPTISNFYIVYFLSSIFSFWSPFYFYLFLLSLFCFLFFLYCNFFIHFDLFFHSFYLFFLIFISFFLVFLNLSDFYLVVIFIFYFNFYCYSYFFYSSFIFSSFSFFFFTLYRFFVFHTFIFYFPFSSFQLTPLSLSFFLSLLSFLVSSLCPFGLPATLLGTLLHSPHALLPFCPPSGAVPTLARLAAMAVFSFAMATAREPPECIAFTMHAH